MTEGDLTHRLRVHYCAPAWAYLSQVRNGTGFSRRRTRTADGVAMSLYPSRGLHLHGFEIKVSRSDFVRELKEPDKAEDIARFCHFWWIVAPTVEVAPVTMVPANWGLLVAKGDGLEVAKQAVFKEAAAPDFAMLASIFRNVHGSMMPMDAIEPWKRQTEQAAREQARVSAEHEWKHQVEALTDDVKSRTDMLARFERLLGCRLTDYNSERHAATLKLAEQLSVRGGGVLRALRELNAMAEQLKPAIAEAAEQIEGIQL